MSTLYVRLKLDLSRQFSRIKHSLGLENDTEVVRSLINWYYKEHKEELENISLLEHYNINEQGVIILDLEIPWACQIYFKPKTIFCEYCEAQKCKHIDYALSLDKVQAILKEKGWRYNTRERGI